MRIIALSWKLVDKWSKAKKIVYQLAVDFQQKDILFYLLLIFDTY
jgi:hypothetical protein